MSELADLQTPLFQRVTFPLVKALVRVLFWILGPIRVRGEYRVPSKGGALILANHTADIDPIVTSVACRRPIYFMSKSELFDMPGVRSVLKTWRCFPVKRGEPDRGAIKRAVDLLKAGNLVCVYPEGQLSETGELQELKAGVALIVRMAQVPVICLGLQNANKVMPYGSLIPRPSFRSILAEWGEPHTFDKGAQTEEIMAWAEGQLRELTNQAVS